MLGLFGLSPHANPWCVAILALITSPYFPYWLHPEASKN